MGKMSQMTEWNITKHGNENLPKLEMKILQMTEFNSVNIIKTTGYNIYDGYLFQPFCLGIPR